MTENEKGYLLVYYNYHAFPPDEAKICPLQNANCAFFCCVKQRINLSVCCHLFHIADLHKHVDNVPLERIKYISTAHSFCFCVVCFVSIIYIKNH